MANQVVKVTATGLVVAMVLTGYTAQAGELNINLNTNSMVNAETVIEKSDTKNTNENSNCVVGFRADNNLRFTTYCVNDTEDIKISTAKSYELSVLLEKANKTEISKEKMILLYNDIKGELQLFDVDSKPLGSIAILDNDILLYDEYNTFTKLSKYFRIKDKNLYNEVDTLINGKA